MKTLGTALGLVCIAVCLAGCAVGWQINMPASYGQCHSRGSSYNALATKAMSPSGEAEAVQQQRASTTTGDALGTTVEADKATDLAAAKDQSQIATETAKGQHEGQGTATGAVTPTSTPTDTTSIAPSLSVAPGGLAVTSSAAPAASPGTTSATAAGTKADAPATAAPPSVAELEADVANCQRVAELVGSGGAADGADTPAQAQAKAALKDAEARLAAAKAGK